MSYLNTKPLVYGFEQGVMKDEIELQYEYPSRIAAMLLNDQIDVGLVPVAIIPKLKECHIITDFCIGADGAVASVCLFSEVPLENVEKVLLDYQSRTSVELAKLLIKNYWKLNPELVDGKEDFRENIKGTTAGLVIGDRAFEQRKISPYIYDLGEAWKNFTGLPFVFAAWVSNKKLPASFVDAFNKANAIGLNNLNLLLRDISSPFFDLREYYTKCIRYHLDEHKLKGLDLFLQNLS